MEKGGKKGDRCERFFRVYGIFEFVSKYSSDVTVYFSPFKMVELII